MMAPFKERFLAFLGRMLSVTLGIVITFTVQGILDRQRDKKSVRTALELVRKELTTNLEDIAVLGEYLQQEQKSAQYLSDNKKVLKKCPADSVNFHTGIVRADVSVALSHDALELLKMSSLFPKIGDNNLSMKIIRAYDACDLTVSNVARYLTRRDNHRAEVARWLIDQPIPEEYMDTGDIQDAIDAIDTFLRK